MVICVTGLGITGYILFMVLIAALCEAADRVDQLLEKLTGNRYQ